jgi:hypothetical protein
MAKQHNTSGSDPQWISNVKDALDKSVEDVDEQTLSRLQQARRVAIRAARDKRSASPQYTWLMPAGVAATLLVATGIALNTWFTQEPEQNQLAVIEDITILSSPEELELYEELEFYQWLAEEQDDDVG